MTAAVFAGVLPATLTAQVAAVAAFPSVTAGPDLPAADPFPSTPTRYLPPPSSQSVASAPAVSPSAAPQTHAAPLSPREGYTADSHWTSDGKGHVTDRIYLTPTFRKDSTGWHAVDPTVQPSGSVTQPLSADTFAPVHFGNSAQRLVQFLLGGGPVTLQAQGLAISAPQLQQDGSVTYSDVATDTDLHYTLSPGGVKEELLLRSPSAPTSFSFFLDDPSGQLGSPHVLAADGPVSFDRAIADNVYLQLGHATAFEQRRGTAAPGSAHMTVQRSGEGWVITESVDKAWLAGKTYPVILDPSVYTTATIGGYNSPIVDYWVRADYSAGGCQTSCFGNPPNSLLNVGGVASSASGTWTNWYDRSLVRYDLSGIPAGSSVSSGQATFYNTGCESVSYGAPCPGGPTVEVDRYTGAFPSSGTTMSTVLANTDTTASTTLPTCNSTGGFNSPCPMTFDLTGEVQRWIAGTDANNGMVIRGQGEGGNIGGPVFFSTYYGNQPGAYPYITITYSPPPSAPSNVQASQASSTSANVTWGAASTQGGDAITGYTVTTYKAGAAVGSMSVCGTCTSATVTALTPNTAYYFTVYASNDWTNGGAVQSNTVTLNAPPLISKTSDFSGTYMLPGQMTTFHLRITSPGGTTPVTSVSDVLPSGFAFADSTLGLVHVSSSVSGAPTSCAAPSCTLSGTILALNLSPALSLGPSDHLQIDYPAVAVDTGRGCLSEVNTASVSNQYGTTPASLAIATCESGLGFESYWRYVTRSLGAGGKAAINVASGNLVLQQDDSTPIQAHGRLAFVLRRTYNSGDTAVATLPGTLGSGWQFNVSEADDIVGNDAAGASALYLPTTSTVVGSPFAVTLVDRDGTRHVYQPNALSAALDIQSLSGSSVVQDVTSLLSTLYPLTIQLAQGSSSYHPASPYNHLCVDQTFTPPAGVHMWLWRYIAVDSSGSACAPAAGTSAAIAGYGAETTDRVRYEFSADGHLLAMADEAGNRLVYAYGSQTANTQTITAAPPYPDAGPFSVPTSITEPSTSRSMTFSPTWSGTQITGFAVVDPAGRQTTYKLDGQYPSAHLVEVDNPDGSVLHYLYGGTCNAAYGAATNAAANEMCGETDLRGSTTYFTYTSTSADGVAYPQLPRANAITDRRESGVASPSSRQDSTQLSYYESTSPNYVRSDQAGERRRFMGIDGAGRVAEIDDGNTSDQYVHVTKLTWDGSSDYQTGRVTYCRQPDGGADNDLCHVVRQNPGFSAPDENTTYTYGDEGQLLATDQCLGAASSSPTSLPPCPATLDTTSGYGEQYFETTGTVATFSDSDTGYNSTTGHVGVASTNRGGSASNRIDGGTLFAVVVKTQDVPPRGNTSPPSGQTSQQQVSTYGTTYVVDASTSSAPSTPHSGGICPSSGTNTGLTCESDGPAFDSSGAHAVTRFTYEQHGQRATMASPKAVAQGGGSYQYFYYPDPSGTSDNTQRYDLSGHTPQGGWLKAVMDPTGAFVAYAYDAAGNAVRVWDRDGTRGYAMASFPGTASGGGAPCAYSEARHSSGAAYGQCPTSIAPSAYANPWRYLLFQRDQLGNATTYQADRDGNVTLSRPPRGNPTTGAVTTYDVSQAFDANDNPTCLVTPVEAAGGTCASPPSTATTYTYDAFNNRTVTKDPRGHYTITSYDTVNRSVQAWFGRGAMPSNSALVPAGCHQAGTQGGDPSQYGSGSAAPMICSTRMSYDDVDNVITTADANAQTTTRTFDSVHRKVQEVTPRDAGITETHAWLYDADGHVTDDCPPRQFAEGGGTCTSAGIFSTHNVYDASGRVASTTAYRSSGVVETTTSTYDADGNVVRHADANGVATTDTYDLLDRKTSQTQPRDSSTTETTSWAYDPAGNVTAVIEPGPSPVNTSFTTLVIDGSQYPQSAPYVYTGSPSSFNKVVLQNNGWMTVPAFANGSGGVLQMLVGGDFSVCSGCGVAAAGKGYAGGSGSSSGSGSAGAGPGAGGGGSSSLVNGVTPTAGGGGGAGHLGSGAAGTSGALAGGTGGAAGNAYGASDLSDTTSNPYGGLGSGGGGGAGQLTMAGANGGAGGAFVHISAETMEISGVIDATGIAGASSGTGPGGGGGSGGEVWLSAKTMTVWGTSVDVSGGQGGGGLNGVNGGSGSAGRIRLDYGALNGSPPVHVTAQSSISIVTAYSYDADNRLVDTVQAADNASASVAGTADGAHNVRTRLMYDPDGHVVAQFDPRAFVSSTANPDALLMTRTDFDADGRPTKAYTARYDNTDDGGTYSDLGLSGTSATQSAQCPTGQSPQSVSGVPSYPSGAGLCVTTVTYDAAGNRLTLTTPTARSDSSSYVNFTYTDDNRIATVEAPDPSHPGSRLTGASPAMAYVYDGDGRLIQSTDANGAVTSTSYFADGLMKSVAAQPNGSVTHTTTYGYDANGNRTSVTDAAGHATTSVYFADNHLQSSSDALGDTTSYTYDGNGQPVTVASPSAKAKDASNTAGTPGTYCYTQDHLVAMSLLPVSSDGSLLRQTTYKYDDAGRKIEQEIEVVPPPASGQQCVPQSRTTPGGPTFSYYNDGRLSSQTGRNGEQMSFTYDAAGNLASAWDGGSNLTVAATYYADGLLRTVDDHYRQTQFMADGDGSTAARVELVDGSSTVYTTTYAYNAAELPSSMSSSIVTGSTQWSYDAGGRMTSETDGNGQAVARSFNADSTLASQILKTSAGSPLATWSYLYDADYRITQQQFAGSGAGGSTPVQSTYCYGYDNASRLNGFQVLGSGSSCGTVPANIAHDHDGNRTAYTDAQGNQVAYCYNADDSVSSIQSGTSTPNCTTPPANARAVQYAPFGGVSDDGCATYNYDGFDRLGTVTSKNASGCSVRSASYLYDGLSRQYYHNDSGVDAWLHYDGLSSQPAVDSSSAGYDTVYALSSTDTSVAVAEEKSGGNVQYLTGDGQGDIVTATSPTQGVACTVRLDPFGNPVQPASVSNPCNTGTMPDPFVYRGARRDSATGNYQLGPRTYDPTKSSFLTPDTFQAGQPAADLALGTDPLTSNRYTYVNGDPVNLSDPTGHCDCSMSPDAQHCDPAGTDPNGNALVACGNLPSPYRQWDNTWQAHQDVHGLTADIYKTRDFLKTIGSLAKGCITSWAGAAGCAGGVAALTGQEEIAAALFAASSAPAAVDCIQHPSWSACLTAAAGLIPAGGLATKAVVRRLLEANAGDAVAGALEGGASRMEGSPTAAPSTPHLQGPAAQTLPVGPGARLATEGAAAAGGSSTTTLYRAVGQSELSDVLRFGDYGLSPSGGGKYFSLSRAGAREFMNSPFNAGRSMTLTSIDIPTGMLQRGFSFFDTGGASASIHFADDVLPDFYQSVGLPNLLEAPWVPTIGGVPVP